MASTLQSSELQTHLQKLKTCLTEFPDGGPGLEQELESASKHVLAYVKIVKVHIQQLAQVLDLENHNKRGIANASLAEPVQQLMELFDILQEEDVEILENLTTTARHWQEETELNNASTQKVTDVELATGAH